MRHWEVIVGNVGVAHSGDIAADAYSNFNAYKKLSNQNEGRVAGEHVVLLADKTVVKEYIPVPLDQRGVRTITMSLSACCGTGAKTTRELNYEQFKFMLDLAEDLNKNDGHSSDFTVPFFYVSPWEGE